LEANSAFRHGRRLRRVPSGPTVSSDFTC
jgi:hypothetical protein